MQAPGLWIDDCLHRRRQPLKSKTPLTALGSSFCAEKRNTLQPQTGAYQNEKFGIHNCMPIF